MCNFRLKFFDKNQLCSFALAAGSSFQYVPKIGVHSSWSRQIRRKSGVVNEKKIVKKQFQMCNFGLHVFRQKIYSAASLWRPAAAFNSPQNRCAQQLVGRKSCSKKNVKIVFRCVILGYKFFDKNLTLQRRSGGRQQLPIVPKIGVHSSWSGEKVDRKILKIVFRCVILGQNFLTKNQLCSVALAAGSSFPIVPKIGVHSSWSGEKVVRKKIFIIVFRCVIFEQKIFENKSTLQRRSGRRQQLPIVLKIGVNISWLGRKNCWGTNFFKNSFQSSNFGL